MKVLHISSGNFCGGVEALLATLARARLLSGLGAALRPVLFGPAAVPARLEAVSVELKARSGPCGVRGFSR